MAGEFKIVGVVLCFAAFAGVALTLAPDPAVAQIMDPQARGQEARRPALRPSLPADTSPFEEEERRAFEDGRFGPGQAATAPEPPPEDGVLEQPSAQSPQAIAEDEEEQQATDDASGEARPRLRRLPAAQDGDPVTVIETPAPQDGIVDLTEVPGAVEGREDITQVDMRSPEDVRAFAAEPAGYDPLLLQADEYNPVFRPSTFQGFAFDPFPPIGTKIGSFLLFTTLEANYDFNSNIFASPEALSDSALEVRPAARLASNWSRHAVEVRASGDLSFHDRFTTEDDRAYLVEGLGRVDVTSFSNFQGLIAHEFAQESRSAINAETAGTRPNVTVDRLRTGYNQRFNRLSVQLRGNIIDTSYSDNLFNGQVQSNADRNYTLYEEAVRPRWEFSPYLFAFSDISFNQRDYKIPASSDGILRSSTGERYRFGLSFGDVGEIFRGNISLGYGHQVLDNHVLPAVDGLLIDADLAWQVSALTVLSFTASSEIAETITADSPGVLERNYGLEARHSFSRYLVGTAGVSYFTRDFANADINEAQFTAAVGSEYYLNPWSVLFARYQHTDFQSNQPQSSYTVEEAQAGIRLRH